MMFKLSFFLLSSGFFWLVELYGNEPFQKEWILYSLPCQIIHKKNILKHLDLTDAGLIKSGLQKDLKCAKYYVGRTFLIKIIYRF